MHLVGQLTPRGVEREPEVVGEALQQALEVLRDALARLRPGQDHAISKADGIVGNEQVGIHCHLRAEAGALGTCPEGRIERERARFDLGQLKRVTVGARELLGEVAPGGVSRLIDVVDGHKAVGQAKRGLERVGEPGQDVVGRDQAVDDDGNVMFELLLQGRRLAELDLLSVDDRARVSAGRERLEQVDELALLLGDDRADHLVAGARGQRHELVGDLLHRLAFDLLAADRAVRDADARPEQAHVVVDLGDGSDRRPGVAVGRLLVDRDGGAQALDEVDVGAIDLPEELAGVCGEGFDVPALAFGEDRVERHRRLAGARKTGEDDERITRNFEVDVFQIVDARAPDTELRERGNG